MARKRIRSHQPSVQLAQQWQKEFRGRRRFYVTVGGTFVAFIVALTLFNIVYAQKVFPGVTVGGFRAGGLTKEELATKLNERVQSLEGKELKISVDGKELTVVPTKDWELAYDVDKTVEAAMRVGRRGDLLSSLQDQVTMLFAGRTVPARYSVKRDRYNAFVEKVTKEVEIPEQDAQFVFKGKELIVEEERIGKRIAGDGLDKVVMRALETLSLSPPLTLSLAEAHPAVTAAQAETLKSEVTRLVANDLTLVFQDRRFAVRPNDLLAFVELAADPQESLQVVAVISEPKVLQYLESIARDIDQKAVDARLTIADGRASIFSPSRDGYKVKRREAAKDIADALEKRRADTSVTEITLAVEVTKADVRTETINELGIKELIGRGTTTFTGSPENRVHNISVGAASFNGLLIKPGETFSAVKALGNIDTSTGYRAELVIKEDRLIPETGGGLCQVSTTLFRAALNSGVEIVERRNHSFRVRYYEPPVGMDATIYDPAPDFKFKNDTPSYILIQTKVEGNKLTFDFYGTKDGRVATTTTPTVTDITQPGDPAYIEDPGLAPGEQKQIEKAVPGANASFTYTVKKDGKVLHQKTFTSHYVAWRAKYLVGPPAAPGASPTPTEPVPAAPAATPPPGPSA